LDEWSKRQGDTAAHGPEHCNRRLCACHDRIERQDALSRIAPIILDHNREAATADAARSVDFVHGQFRPGPSRNSPMRRFSG
jgi:hypothetical protein